MNSSVRRQQLFKLNLSNFFSLLFGKIILWRLIKHVFEMKKASSPRWNFVRQYLRTLIKYNKFRCFLFYTDVENCLFFREDVSVKDRQLHALIKFMGL